MDGHITFHNAVILYTLCKELIKFML